MDDIEEGFAGAMVLEPIEPEPMVLWATRAGPISIEEARARTANADLQQFIFITISPFKPSEDYRTITPCSSTKTPFA
jgi:hypothetical protein